MSKLFIEVVGVNRTENYRMYDNIFEKTIYDNKGELYHALVKEYGRCTGKMYVDMGGKSTQIGWVFLKRAKYSDKGTFLQETWIGVHSEKPTTKVTPHYIKF